MAGNAMTSRRRWGFTLVELLTVMAIVAIAAALTFPVFVRVRERGRQTLCAANIRQLGSAFDLYRRLWDDVLPPAVDSNGVSWKHSVYPFVSSVGVFRCPSNIGEEINPTHLETAGKTPLQFPASYSLNLEPQLLAAGSRSVTPDAAVLSAGWLADVKRPDSVILLLESRVPDPVATLEHLSTQLVQRIPDLRALPYGLVQTHGERSNWLFMDGHIASLLPRATVRPSYLWSDRPRFGGVVLTPSSRDWIHPEYR